MLCCKLEGGGEKDSQNSKIVLLFVEAFSYDIILTTLLCGHESMSFFVFFCDLSFFDLCIFVLRSQLLYSVDCC
jgi:hypothetical protein